MANKGVIKSRNSPLLIGMSPDTGNFVVDFDFDCEVFDDEDRKRVINHFLKVLDSFLEDHTRSLHSFSLLTAGEQQLLLEDFNRTEMLVPHDQTFPQLFEAQVRLTPHQVAVTYENESFTYAQLNARVNRLARYLRANGVGPENAEATPLQYQYSALDVSSSHAESRRCLTERKTLG